MPWYQRPEYAKWIALVANLIFIAISVLLPVITASNDPWKLGITTLALLTGLGNYILTWLQNTGMVTVKASAIVQTGTAADHDVIVPTAGR